MKQPKDLEADGMAFNPTDSPIEAVVRAGRACGISEVGDTCGVCHKHFQECEDDLATHEDPPFTRDKMWFACPGARIRQALVRYDNS
jgi:hypothetical protein